MGTQDRSCQKKMLVKAKLVDNVFVVYSQFMKLFFFIFLFGTLSFGRAFSILHLDTPLGVVFVTEIFLLLNIPVLLDRYKSLAKLPKLFLVVLSIYFIYAFYYLCVGLLRGNIFALRDIVLSAYILFLPITFIYLNNLKSIKSLILIIILSNIINLFSARCLILGSYPSEAFRNFIINSKLFNFGLYLGIVSSFIISFYEYVKPKVYRFLALIVLSCDVFMLITISLTSLWIATFALSCFFLLMLKGRFLKLLICFIPVFILTSSIIYYLDAKIMSTANKDGVIAELKGLKLFFYQVPVKSEPAKPSFKAEADLVQVPVKSEPAKPSFKEEADLVQVPAQSEPAKPSFKAEADLVQVPAQSEPAKPSFKAEADLVQVSAQSEPAKPSFKTEADLVQVPVKNEPKKIYTKEEISQKNIDWRLSIWKQTLKFAMDSPLFGKGFGVYPVYEIGTSYQFPRKVYFDPWMVPAHNQFVTIFFKMGILGLLLFLVINIYVFAYSFSYIKKYNDKFINNLIISLLGAFVFWHALAFSFDVIDSPPTSIFLWIILGMIFAGVNNDKSLLNK